jgi:hypothetical protein
VVLYGQMNGAFELETDSDISMRREACFVVDGPQPRGFLVVGGDLHVVRVWYARSKAVLGGHSGLDERLKHI